MGLNYFKSGLWNVICDVCGQKKKNTEVRKRWDGFMVCHEDWESRHVSDFIKIRSERNNVRDPRTEPNDQFINVTYIDTGDRPACTPMGSSGVAGVAVAGCMVSGNLYLGYL
jgi:hypothetical protein